MEAGRVSVRLAQESDRQKLANLIHFGSYVHRHLDWCTPLDWIGHQPYLVVEHKGELEATLACPPNPPNVSWIRLFATSSRINVEGAWDTLWKAAEKQISGRGNIVVAAMPLQGWFENLVIKYRFSHHHDVVMLSWEGSELGESPYSTTFAIRLMNFDDLNSVQKLDADAFSPVWRVSREMLEIAFQQATIATVAEDDDGVIGYQISTAGPGGGHLARLAVHPRAQEHGIGYTLVRDMLAHFSRRGAFKITVNTQSDNVASLALYEKIGFKRTGEIYPVFLYNPGKVS
jgi:ribosomal protein S18 acetylase RimI-like enzyme